MGTIKFCITEQPNNAKTVPDTQCDIDYQVQDESVDYIMILFQTETDDTRDSISRDRESINRDRAPIFRDREGGVSRVHQERRSRGRRVSRPRHQEPGHNGDTGGAGAGAEPKVITLTIHNVMSIANCSVARTVCTFETHSF